MLEPVIELLDAWVLSQPEDVATADPGDPAGAGDDREMRGSHAVEPVRVGGGAQPAHHVQIRCQVARGRVEDGIPGVPSRQRL